MEPFADFLTRLKEILREKEIELIVIGLPRRGSGRAGEEAIFFWAWRAVGISARRR